MKNHFLLIYNLLIILTYTRPYEEHKDAQMSPVSMFEKTAKIVKKNI